MRVVQITDLHLLPDNGSRLYGVDTMASLELVLEKIMELPEPAEAIIATGDLAEDGSEESYARLRQRLARLGVPVYVLPGNHDDPAAMRATLVGDGVYFQRAAQFGDWTILFVNSKVTGEDHGFVGTEELCMLENQIAGAGDASIVVALHHTPVPRCPSSGCQLGNATEFLELLRGHRAVKATIAGHTHTTVEAVCDGLVLYTTPSTFAQMSHAELDDHVDHEDFLASHSLDVSTQGFRVLDLMPDGRFTSKVHTTTDC